VASCLPFRGEAYDLRTGKDSTGVLVVGAVTQNNASRTNEGQRSMGSYLERLATE
jgi:hypothetical protein